MSIIVKGVKMPRDCPVCPLAHWNKLDRFTGCELKKRYFDKEDMETRGRPSFCPLVEIPPHGRLVDADVLNDMINRSYPMTDRVDVHNGYGICQEMIKQLPTIIEAEEVSE